jgi:hypothetical protein
MKDVGEFVANPFGLGDAGSGAVGYLAKSLGLDNSATIDNAKATLDEVLEKSNSVSSQNKGIYNNYYNQMQGLYGEGASAYSDAVKNLANAIENRKDFSYTGSVDDFLDPARNQRVAAAMDAINNSASAGGSRFSSNYLDRLAQKQQALASDEYKSAYDRLMQDRQQQLAEWQTGQQKISNLGTLAGLYQSDRNQLGNAMGDYYSSIANQNNADLQTYADVAANKANLESQKKSGVGGLLGTVGSVISAIF